MGGSACVVWWCCDVVMWWWFDAGKVVHSSRDRIGYALISMIRVDCGVYCGQRIIGRHAGLHLRPVRTAYSAAGGTVAAAVLPTVTVTNDGAVTTSTTARPAVQGAGAGATSHRDLTPRARPSRWRRGRRGRALAWPAPARPGRGSARQCRPSGQ